jgi:hypothetical protein
MPWVSTPRTDASVGTRAAAPALSGEAPGRAGAASVLPVRRS